MKRFLRKLINLNIWGGRHTEMKNLGKAYPRYLRGSKEAKGAVKARLRKQFNTLWISTGGEHVSLKSHKQSDIFSFVGEE
jgi:hypothetical protein